MSTAMLGRSSNPIDIVTARLYRRARRSRRVARFNLVVGIIVAGVVVTVCVFGPLVGLPDPNAIGFGQTLLPPSRDHLFGTDALGRDVFSRVVYGGRVDLQVAFIVTYVPLVIGTLLGALAGYYRGWVDGVISWSINLILALPFLVATLALIAIVGPGLLGVYIGIILVNWVIYARIARAGMLQLREAQYVLAAQSLGLPRSRVLFRHAIPNLVRPGLTFSVLDIIFNILALASLSYLGLGVQPPTPEWGAIIAEGQSQLFSGGWWISTLPGVVVAFFGVGLSLIVDGLSDKQGLVVK